MIVDPISRAKVTSEEARARLMGSAPHVVLGGWLALARPRGMPRRCTPVFGVGMTRYFLKGFRRLTRSLGPEIWPQGGDSWMLWTQVIRGEGAEGLFALPDVGVVADVALPPREMGPTTVGRVLEPAAGGADGVVLIAGDTRQNDVSDDR